MQSLQKTSACSSIVESVAVHAVGTPNKLCLADAENRLTYRETWERVVGCAKAVSGLGVNTKSRVLIENNQGVEFVVALLAVQLLGAYAVPLEKNIAHSRGASIVDAVNPEVHIGPKALESFESVPSVALKQLCWDAADSSDWNGGFPAEKDVSEVLFSTGTTGIPKGVVLSHRNDAAMSENIISGLQMTDETVELITSPINHSFGFRRVNANLKNGSSVVICEGALALGRMFGLMDEYAVNAMTLVPNMLSVILKLSGNRLAEYADALDYVQLSSAMLAEQDKTRLMELLPHTRLYNFYGSTEAGATCLYDFNEMTDKDHCIGHPIGNSRFVMLDDNHNPIVSSPDNMGVLASSGDTCMIEYYGDPGLTQETLVNGYVLTKDLGYIDEEGYVYILGRVDDVINFGGIKIAPEEIEHEINAHPAVRDCACVALKDDIAGQIPVLCVVLHEGENYDEKQFGRFVTSVLDAKMRPQRIVVVDEIPRTYNGKIRRKELTDRLSTSA